MSNTTEEATSASMATLLRARRPTATAPPPPRTARGFQPTARTSRSATLAFGARAASPPISERPRRRRRRRPIGGRSGGGACRRAHYRDSARLIRRRSAPVGSRLARGSPRPGLARALSPLRAQAARRRRPRRRRSYLAPMLVPSSSLPPCRSVRHLEYRASQFAGKVYLKFLLCGAVARLARFLLRGRTSSPSGAERGARERKVKESLPAN